MGLTEQAKNDVAAITSNLAEWGLPITFTSPDNLVVNVVGRHAKHNLGVDTDGNMVNSKHAYIAVSEQLLTALNYPVRNSKGEVSIGNHRVDVADSTGTVKKYKIQSAYPDETLGLLTCILQDYAQ